MFTHLKNISALCIISTGTSATLNENKIMNIEKGLKSVLHTLELTAVAAEEELPVEPCKIALVVNATLQSIQTEFCANTVVESESDAELELAKHIGTDRFMPELAKHVSGTLADGESGFCKGIAIAISVLNSLEASAGCK